MSSSRHFKPGRSVEKFSRGDVVPRTAGKKVQLANLLFKGNYAVSGDIDAVKKVTGDPKFE